MAGRAAMMPQTGMRVERLFESILRRGFTVSCCARRSRRAGSGSSAALQHAIVQSFPRLRAEAAAILALGAPLVAHNISHMGMQFADTVMAGRLGPVDLAAVAVGGSLWMPVFIFILGLLMALSPTVAQLFGANRQAEIGHYTRQGFWLALFAAAAGMLLLRNTAPLLAAIGIDPAVVPVADGYLKAIAWGLPATCLYHVLRFTSEGVSHTRPLLVIALMALVINVFGNYVLMYGKLGFPALGAVGCGWASAIVMWVMLGAMLWYVRRRPLYRELGIFTRFEWPGAATQTELLRLGAPIGVTIFMEGSLFAAAALLMGSLGTDIVAAHQIAINFAAIMFMVPLGLSMAASIRVGQAAGRGSLAQAKTSGYTGIAVCAGFMAVSAVCMLLFRDAIAAMYTADPQVREIAAGLLVMAAIFQLSDGLQVSGAAALRGLKDTRMPMLITVLAYWGIGFSLAWLFGIHLDLGPRAVWVGLIAGLTTAALLLNWRFYRVTPASFRNTANVQSEGGPA